MYYDSSNQRDTYKLLEQITTGKFKSGTEFLSNLINEVVKHEEFKITGGRMWELNPDGKSYTLKYQHGNVRHIPDNYTILIKDHPILEDLVTVRTKLNYENDPVLLETGILVYSVTGVGEIIKTSNGKFYQYVLGFNAPEILQSFYETLSIISSLGTVTLRGLVSEQVQKKMQRDIDKAAEIQRNLLPEHYMEFHDYKIFGACIPDSEVGGDYFDYLKNMDDEEERLGVLICDASSKGLPAAIQALFVSGAVKMAQVFSPKMSSLFSRLNTLVFETFPYERFVTLFYCELSLTSNRLVLYANAGHCSPIHYRPDKDSVSLLEPTGGLLGIVKNQKFKVENLIMRPGDILALYTDGINEAQTAAGEFFGEQRIIDIIRENKDDSPRDIALKIIEEVQKFATDTPYTDDRTVIIIKRDKK